MECHARRLRAAFHISRYLLHCLTCNPALCKWGSPGVDLLHSYHLKFGSADLTQLFGALIGGQSPQSIRLTG